MIHKVPMELKRDADIPIELELVGVTDG